MNPPPDTTLVRRDYSREQLDIIKHTLAPTLDDVEFAFYIEVCKSQGLDPFAKEIHVQKRRDGRGKPQKYKLVIMVGIDGYRRRAADTGQLDGQTEPQWCGEDGVWKDVWIPKTPPSAARIGILRKGCAQPFWGVALYREYVAMEPDEFDGDRVIRWKVASNWQRMPVGQLMKCAESLGLRKAFPRELGVLRTIEEMQASQHDPEDPSSTPAGAVESKPKPERVADKQESALKLVAERVSAIASGKGSVITIPKSDIIPAFELYGISEDYRG